MKADDVADLTRSEWTRVIDECIHDRKWRDIFKRRWLDGIKFEPLVGALTLTAADVDKLYRYITGGLNER